MTVTDSGMTSGSDSDSGGAAGGGRADRLRRINQINEAARTGIGVRLGALRDDASFLPNRRDLAKLSRARDGVSMMQQAPRTSSEGIGPLQHMIRMVPAARRHRPPRLGVGDVAPEFEMLGSQGRTVSSASLAGRPYALRLTRAVGSGIICPACVPGLDDLVSTHGDFAAAGAELLVVFPVSHRLATHVVEALELPYPLYSDEDRALYTAYETRFSSGAPLPAWIVVDADGVIRFVWRATQGGLLDAYPEAAEILAELRRLQDAR